MYKYKLKEGIGDVTVKNGIKSTVTDIDQERNSVTWKIEYETELGAPLIKMSELIDIFKELEMLFKDDQMMELMYEYGKKLRNNYRSHIRDKYPQYYKEMKRKKEFMREETEGIEEESISSNAGAYNTPFAFNKNKKADKASLKYYYRLGFKNAPVKIKGSGLEVKKLWNENENIKPKRWWEGRDGKYWTEYKLGIEYETDEHPVYSVEKIKKIVRTNLENEEQYYTKLIRTITWGN